MAAEPQAPTETTPKPGASKLLVVALLATNVLTVGGLVAVVLLGGSSSASADAPADAAVDVATATGEPGAGGAPATSSAPVADLGPMTSLGTFVINLASQPSSYLKVSIKLELSGERTIEEVKSRDAQLRDAVIAYLSSLQLEQTVGQKSKDEIRGGIQTRLNAFLQTGAVRGVYFIEFVTQ